MNDTNVPKTDLTSPTEILDRLASELGGLSRELGKAAGYLIEHPNEIGVSSIRMIAENADVKPNTLVRLARTIGFEGYEDFRRPFREEIRQGRDNFPDRASWLQSLAHGGRLNGLYADMASDAIGNIEHLFAQTDATSVKLAADAIVRARTTYVLGVGVANAFARNFAYLVGMALGSVKAIPENGSLPVDGLLQADEHDVLLAMTFKPYRREVVEAVNRVRKRGVTLIGVSDSPASPILTGAHHKVVVPTQTPQFFTSTVALSAFMETLTAFVVAEADQKAVENIERFHRRRHELGIYWQEDDI